MEKHFSDNINVLDSAETERFKVEVLEYKELNGSNDPFLGKDLYYVQKSGMRLRQIKVTVRNGGLITEPGALHFHKGSISCEANIGGVGGLAKKCSKISLRTNRLSSHATPELVRYTLNLVSAIF